MMMAATESRLEVFEEASTSPNDCEEASPAPAEEVEVVRLINARKRPIKVRAKPIASDIKVR
jgi:hypothetical protein